MGRALRDAAGGLGRNRQIILSDVHDVLAWWVNLRVPRRTAHPTAIPVPLGQKV